MLLAILAYKTDDIIEYEKLFNERIWMKLDDLNKFFEKREYIAGDYLTYADFAINEKLAFINGVA